MAVNFSSNHSFDPALMMQCQLTMGMQEMSRTLNEVLSRLKSLEENQVQYSGCPSSKELLTAEEFKVQLNDIVKNEWPHFLKENLKSFRYLFPRFTSGCLLSIGCCC